MIDYEKLVLDCLRNSVGEGRTAKQIWEHMNRESGMGRPFPRAIVIECLERLEGNGLVRSRIRPGRSGHQRLYSIGEEPHTARHRVRHQMGQMGGELKAPDPMEAVGGMVPGDHVFFLYDGEEEHRALITPYLRQGLERKEKVVYITDAHSAETILGYLRGDGVDVEPYLDSGQLAVLPAEAVYLPGGTFDPDRVIELLRTQTKLALAEGYSALRATGEMSSALRGIPGSERLLEYEAKVNRFFPGSRLLGLCQYDRRLFGPSMLHAAGRWAYPPQGPHRQRTLRQYILSTPRRFPRLGHLGGQVQDVDR
ncbi:MAG: MEDS domain-containing protein [Deltaproteobacteria bacterium]|nr:MEDS domain-containing protein [Deltaproteobacteria bacterium]